MPISEETPTNTIIETLLKFTEALSEARSLKLKADYIKGKYQQMELTKDEEQFIKKATEIYNDLKQKYAVFTKKKIPLLIKNQPFKEKLKEAFIKGTKATNNKPFYNFILDKIKKFDAELSTPYTTYIPYIDALGITRKQLFPRDEKFKKYVTLIQKISKKTKTKEKLYLKYRDIILRSEVALPTKDEITRKEASQFLDHNCRAAGKLATLQKKQLSKDLLDQYNRLQKRLQKNLKLKNISDKTYEANAILNLDDLAKKINNLITAPKKKVPKPEAILPKEMEEIARKNQLGTLAAEMSFIRDFVGETYSSEQKDAYEKALKEIGTTDDTMRQLLLEPKKPTKPPKPKEEKEKEKEKEKIKMRYKIMLIIAALLAATGITTYVAYKKGWLQRLRDWVRYDIRKHYEEIDEKEMGALAQELYNLSQILPMAEYKKEESHQLRKYRPNVRQHIRKKVLKIIRKPLEQRKKMSDK
jgi:hypothetical protein